MIDYNQLLIQSIIVPILFSPICLAIGKNSKKNTGWVAFIPLLYSLSVLAYVAYGFFSGAINGTLVASYAWAPFIGNFVLLADGANIFVAVTIALLACLITIYSMAYMEHEENLGAYFALYLLYSGSMIGAVLTTNLIAFFIFFELMLLPSWAMIGVWGTGAKEKIAFKYFMFTEAGALSLLAGIALTGITTGTFDMLSIASNAAKLPSQLLLVIVSAILLGFFVKMAIFPLHTWLPDAHAEAPTPISALLSPAMIGIGGYAAIRVIYTAFPIILQHHTFMLSLSVLGLITIAYGGIMALAQSDIKRLLAYSSISQMGYLLFGISSISFLGVAGSILHYVNHGLCKASLFMIAGMFIHNYKTRNIKDLGGLAGLMPYTTVAALISFLGLAGIPPFLGFWGEFYIFSGSMYTSLSGTPDIARLLVTAAAIMTAILTSSYGLWTIRRIFYGEPPKHLKNAKEGSKYMLVPVLILVALVVILGIYPTFLLQVIGPAIQIP
jgi:NADH-quinone oxidoreductase subunit M